MSKILHSLKRLSTEDDSEKSLQSCNLTAKITERVPGDDPYVLTLCGTQNETDIRVGAGLSSSKCLIYSIGESLTEISTLSQNNNVIVGIKFSPISKNIVYVAMNKGVITSYDLRAKDKIIAEFEDNTTGKLKPIVSFDISCDDRLLAAGTEHISGDAFILFWDIRNARNKGGNLPLGGYWQSHIEEITSLAFHECKRNTLASGSTDGLINIYDLLQTSEDVALSYSLNTECAVDKIGWFNDDNLWCAEHTELQLWNYDGATPYARYNRNSSQGNDYFVKVHTSNMFEKPFAVVGSKETLKCMYVGDDEMELAYNLTGNKQIVRDSWVHEKTGTLVTGGEGSTINLWVPTEASTLLTETAKSKSLLKISNNKVRDKNRAKPY